jgi:hypothetical protein
MAVPNTFAGGTRLFAEELNENFSDLDGRVIAAASSATNASDLTFGTLSPDRLSTVPSDKLTGNGFPFKIAYGTGTGSDTGAVTITFPVGLFSSAPNWVATSSDVGGARSVTYSVLTESSVTFSTWRTDNNTRNLTAIQWIAVGA